MRRLAIVVAGVVLSAGLAGPAWAHERDGGRARRFHSTSDDRPGEGRAHYDREQHDDGSLF